MFAVPLLRTVGSRFEYIILMGFPLRGVKFSTSKALAAVTNKLTDKATTNNRVKALKNHSKNLEVKGRNELLKQHSVFPYASGTHLPQHHGYQQRNIPHMYILIKSTEQSGAHQYKTMCKVKLKINLIVLE